MKISQKTCPLKGKWVLYGPRLKLLKKLVVKLGNNKQKKQLEILEFNEMTKPSVRYFNL